MWANAQRDGRPAEHRWRPLLNAAKFGWRPLLHRVSEKNCANFFLSQFRQISINFDNFWQKDAKEARIV